MAVGEAICIVGAKGMLGQELVKACRDAALGQAALVHAIDREEIDIADARSTRDVIERLRPALAFNAAAYTDVDGCETNGGLAEAVNAAGPAHLAKVCRDIACRLVHVSTDYVFDGDKRTPYMPEDAVNPRSVYGKTKAEGERRVREILPDHVVVRTSWLFGVHGQNFVKTILRMARQRDTLKIVDDQVGCPTYARDLAAALVALGHSPVTGTYHFCNAGACSWNEFAKEIVRLAGLQARVISTNTAALGRPARRPAYSVLSTDKIARDAGILPRPWKEALAECMKELGPQASS